MNRNDRMKEILKNHKCLNCKYLSYWDWYICGKRSFPWYRLYPKDFIRRTKHYASWVTLDEFRISKFLATVFEKDSFIPDKPIKKCKYYEKASWEKFWTSE